MIPLDRERFSIGRLSYNDVVLAYPQISRQHAELRRINGQWRIADLHSTNGLQINNRRIQEHTLAHGDRVVLAPGISLCYVDDASNATSEPYQATPPDWVQRAAQQFTPHPDVQVGYPTVGPAPSAQPSRPDAIAPLRPRSVYSDDEVPYVPPGMASTGGPALRSQTPDESGHGANGANGPNVFPAWANGAPSSLPASLSPPPAGLNSRPTGYPAPLGPMNSGADAFSVDPYHRPLPANPRSGTPTSPVSKLLHVCQTCGQLTAPDSVYCQNCHNSIAQECSNCRLSLLPIQDRCPRCHTPNDRSVRRAHGGRGE